MSEDKITPANSSDKKISCSFCGKSQEEVKKLIAGPNVRSEEHTSELQSH